MQIAGVLDDLYGGATKARPRADVRQGAPHAVRLGADRAGGGSWRSATGTVADEARRHHRRLVRHRPQVLAEQGLPVRREGLGAQRPQGRHQQGHRPLLGRPHRRLRAQPRRRPRRQVPRPARLVGPAEAQGRPAEGRADPGAAHPGLLRRGQDRPGEGPGHLPRLHRQGQRRLQAPARSWPRPGRRTSTSCPPSTSPPSRRRRPTRRPPTATSPPTRPTPTSSRSASRRSPRRTPTTGATTRTTTRSPRARTPPTPTARGRTVEFREDGQGAERGRPAGRHGRRLQPHRRERPGGHQRPRPGSCPATTSGSSPTARVANSTCCANTAPENAMMGKLVVDSIVTWAKEYKVDGFRFDLMGHHPKANILAVRKALDALTLEKDGVDGKKIILYGEGWNFGEIADDARFVQATQKNMAGTGIATFSDRARDAVRGGGPFDEDPGVQGFASGLYTDPNSSARQRHFGRAEGPPAALPGPDQGRPLRQPRRLPLHRHRRQGGQGLRGRLQRRARRIRGRPRRRPRLRRRARQRVAVRRARLQAARAAPRPPTGPGCRSSPWPRPPSRRARRSPRPAPTCCAPSRWTATPTTAATGSTPSTGTAGTATASGADCRWRPTTSPSGRTPSPC